MICPPPRGQHGAVLPCHGTAQGSHSAPANASLPAAGMNAPRGRTPELLIRPQSSALDAQGDFYSHGGGRKGCRALRSHPACCTLMGRLRGQPWGRVGPGNPMLVGTAPGPHVGGIFPALILANASRVSCKAMAWLDSSTAKGGAGPLGAAASKAPRSPVPRGLKIPRRDMWRWGEARTPGQGFHNPRPRCCQLLSSPALFVFPGSKVHLEQPRASPVGFVRAQGAAGQGQPRCWSWQTPARGQQARYAITVPGVFIALGPEHWKMLRRPPGETRSLRGAAGCQPRSAAGGFFTFFPLSPERLQDPLALGGMAVESKGAGATRGHGWPGGPLLFDCLAKDAAAGPPMGAGEGLGAAAPSSAEFQDPPRCSSWPWRAQDPPHADAGQRAQQRALEAAAQCSSSCCSPSLQHPGVLLLPS